MPRLDNPGGVLHGNRAVAALKEPFRPLSHRYCRRSPRQSSRGRIEGDRVAGITDDFTEVLHGNRAVAALKWQIDCRRLQRRRRFSTAIEPWPH